jgi:hypothetical protein
MPASKNRVVDVCVHNARQGNDQNSERSKQMPVVTGSEQLQAKKFASLVEATTNRKAG